MTSADTQKPSPQPSPATTLAGVQRVFVIPVTADRRLLLFRHGVGTQTYWTYPSTPRGTMRTDTSTLARRLIRRQLGTEPDRTRLVGILESARGRPRSAIYTAGLPQTATEITDSPVAASGSKPVIQALAVTAATLAALDVRPYEITALLSAAGDPAQLALMLPDLAAVTEASTRP